ncbi:hypothetical protein FIU87_05530 [Bacillus sp. THAF10]|nr:hypothetical protein FIU87_05530 [Bacillus sp. THAF10]
MNKDVSFSVNNSLIKIIKGLSEMEDKNEVIFDNEKIANFIKDSNKNTRNY